MGKTLMHNNKSVVNINYASTLSDACDIISNPSFRNKYLNKQ